MNNKWLWLVAGILVGLYVVPMIRAKQSGNQELELVLNRPGFKSSEFIVSALTFAGVLVSALQDYISANTATHLSVYGAAAYVVSRGLAKYEPRSVNPPPSPPAA